MARIKNKHISQSGTEVVRVIEEIYTASIYARLSQERKEAYRGESNSLEMQEELCIDAANEEDIKILRVHKDYEYSGTNFKRPASIEVMGDIRTGRVDCIIVKDMSRFDGEYLEVANYIEKVFPFLGVRFISVNDSLNTKGGIKSDQSYEIAIKNILNNLCAKDISKRIKASKEIKIKQGPSIGAMTPYGYKIDKIDGERVLMMGRKTTDVIGLIFYMTSQSESNVQIAKELTKTYTAPGECKRTGKIFKDREGTRQ